MHKEVGGMEEGWEGVERKIVCREKTQYSTGIRRISEIFAYICENAFVRNRISR